MNSRTVEVANNYGKSVRVKVIYRDNNVENITLDNNKIKVFEISSVAFLEPDACDLKIVVYSLDDDILPHERIIPANENNYLVNINKGNSGFETSVTAI
jgi:hypothetical protein